MGRPLHVKPRPVGTSRRGFFTRGGTAAIALAATPMLALAHRDDDEDDDGRRRGGVRFDHGVASGDPLKHRVILWTRITPTATPKNVLVKYIVATDPQLRLKLALALKVHQMRGI